MKFSLQSIYTWYRNAIRHPQYRWWVILGTLAYLLSPLDISPDMFPIAGQIDDIAIVTLLMTEIFQMITEYFTSPKNNPQVTVDEQSNGEAIDVKAVSVEES